MKMSRTTAGVLAGGVVAVVAVAGSMVLTGATATAADSPSALGIAATGQVSFRTDRASGVPANDFLSGVSGLSATTGPGRAAVDLASATLFGVAPSGTVRLSGVRATCRDGDTAVVLGAGSTIGGVPVAGTYRSARTFAPTPTVRVTVAGGGAGDITAVSARLLGGTDVIQTFTIGRVRCSAASAPTASPTRSRSASATPSPTRSPVRPTRTPSPAPTARPTRHPSPAPTARPTRHPSPAPTVRPTRHPTPAPSPTAIRTSLPVTG